jgi:O-antigen/teichoic acid export membrane protein
MLARKSFLIVISNYLTQIIGMIGLIIIAKFWGGFAPEALGIIAFAMSFIAIFGIISKLGYPQAHVKRISEGKDLGSCIGTFITIKIVLTALMVSAIFLYLFIWKNVLNEGFYDATTESVILVFVAYYIFVSLQGITTHTYVATREIVKQQIPIILGRILKVSLILLVALAGVTALGIASPVNWPSFLHPLQKFISDHPTGSLAMTYVFDMMIVFFSGLWLLRKYPIKKPSWNLFKSYSSFALPLIISSVIGILSLNIDKIMIGYFWTSTEVGYYFVVQRVFEFIIPLSASVAVVLFPTISSYHSLKNLNKIKTTTYLAERYISMIMFPPIIFIIIFSVPIINILLTEAFLPAAPVLIVLSFYTLILCFNHAYSAIINGLNRPKVVAKIGISICITNIPLNFLFIPRNGLLSPFGINGPTGAAVATVISILVGFFGYRLAAKKIAHMKILQTHIPRHIIAGLIMAGVLYLISIYVTTIRWYALLLFAFLGLGIYLLSLYLMKEFNKQDLMFFLDLLNPKKMMKYMSSELKNKKPENFNDSDNLQEF